MRKDIMTVCIKIVVDQIFEEDMVGIKYDS